MTIKTKVIDLNAYCAACMDRQNENYHNFPKDYAARRKADEQIKEEMKHDLAAYFGFESFSDALKGKLFEKAWEDGHSAGYMDVAMGYQDMLLLASFIKTENDLK